MLPCLITSWGNGINPHRFVANNLTLGAAIPWKRIAGQFEDGLKCKATKGERNSHIHSVTPTPHPRRYGLFASAVLRCINNKPTFEAKLQSTWPTYLLKINLYCILTQSSNNAAKRKQCWPYCKMELTGLHNSHAHFLSFSYLISREYLKKSARSVVRDDVLGKFPLAIVGFQC